MRDFLRYIFQTLMLRPTENETIDAIIFFSVLFLNVAAVIGIVIIFLKNEPLRKHKRPIDVLVFRALALVLTQIILEYLNVPLFSMENGWAVILYNILYVIIEMLYLAIILQWLICVDYSLHHSMDHIRRRYRHAALPIFIVGVLDIIRVFVYIRTLDIGSFRDVGTDLLHVLYLALEICYILTAVMLVKRHEKERREPSFLRLEAFIIPFAIGAIVRFYDAPMLAFGMIFTYAAMSRRDKYIDFNSGLYNSGFLDCIGEYWDKKGYLDASAMLALATGHEKEMAGILLNIRIPDCYIINLGEGSFVLLSPEVRRSALKSTENLLKDAAKEGEPPFTVDTRAMNRSDGQTMKEFAAEIRKEASAEILKAASAPDPLKEGGNGSC